LAEKILNRTIKEQDIESLMQIFKEVYTTNQDLTDQAIQKIEALRK
jgi:hypothetical protein